MTIQTEKEINAALEEMYKLEGEKGGGLGVCVVGYPGAGKTTFAEEMESQLKSEMEADVEKFDLTNQREHFYSTNDNYTEEIAARKSLSGKTHGVVDDVQSVEEMVGLAPFFDKLYIVLVLSNVLARHNRLIQREMGGKGREELVSRDALRNQDKCVGNRGVEKIKEVKLRDYELKNVALSQGEIEKASTYLAQQMITDYENLQ